MTNEEIARAFNIGATSGKSNSMFIEGDFIYSYGYHFPIAFRDGYNSLGQRVILFNTDKYSNTTARHKYHVRQAVEGAEIIETNTQALKDLR